MNMFEAIHRIEIRVDKNGNPVEALMYHPKNPKEKITFSNLISVETRTRIGEFPHALIEFDALPVFIYEA